MRKTRRVGGCRLLSASQLNRRFKYLFVTVAAPWCRFSHFHILVAERRRSDSHCHSSGVPLCIQGVASHQRCFICSGPAANLMAPSSAKCPFNLAEENQVVSLTIPARRAPAFSLAVTAGERRTEGGEREKEREQLEPGRRIKSNDSVFTLCIQKCQTLSLSGAVDK